MTSDRIQRQIERLLDEADAAFSRRDWDALRDTANDLLSLEPENVDARTYLAAAERNLDREPDASSTEAPAPASEAAPTSPTQPSSFANGRYSVTRFLGEGGKKRVYLAHDSQLDRDVAFALIKTEGLDEAARVRITREAQAMGRLGSHPHIVTVYDIGEERMPGPSGPGASSAQPYLVLPVLPGGDVEGVIEKAEDHRLPIEQAIKIASETCLGLEFAHGKGIIHRDLKPGNVWLAEDGRAMIGDFGLAVAVDRSRLTQAGMMVGTVNYMPPEQAMGGDVTPQSDLYSLGCMLYEMVCGRPPFVGDESVAIIGQHLNTPPVAPTWHRPDCPPALEALILRLLEKDAGKRPASASEVRQALRGITLSPLPREGEGQGEGATAQPSIGDPLYRRTFVGRENETRQLHQAYDAAVSGQGGLVMVVGEPGIGKTALCEQLATYVSIRGGRTLVGHCYEEGSLSLPYLAFVEAMRTYVLARDPDGLRSDLGSGAAEVARIVSEVRDRVQVELRDASDPEDDRWRLLNAVSTFLRNAASVQPLVIVLEDLHWADRGTLDLLLHVARILQGARLVVVGTYRDVEVDRTHPLSATLAELRRAGNFLRVPLRGLTVDEVHRMYEAIRGNEVAWGQAETVHRATEGNPLFVQEVLRNLVEEGFVVREDGRYVAKAPGEGVPEGLRDVVGRRLSHLSEKTNEVLSIASVIGRDFTLEVLQRVAGLPEDDVLEALEEATARSVIEQRPATASVGFRFTHAFFRQTLYEEIFAPRRIRWHQQVGRALEEAYARRLEEHAAELAEHFSQSTEVADLEKAVRYGELAAERAMNVYAYGDAARYLEQSLHALEVLDSDNIGKRCDLLLALGTSLIAIGELFANRRRVRDEIAVEALSLAETLSDRERAFEACRLALDSDTGAITPALRKWHATAERFVGDDPYARMRLARAQAAALYQDGHALQAGRILREALEIALAAGSPEWQYGITWGLLNLGKPTPEQAQELVANFEGRTREGVSTFNLSSLLQACALVMLSTGERARANTFIQELNQLASRTRHERARLNNEVLDTLLLALDGKLEEALLSSDRSFFSKFQVGFWLGKHDIEPWAQLNESDALVAQSGIALRAAVEGRRQDAEASLQEVIRRIDSTVENETTDAHLVYLLQTAVIIGNQQVAERMLRVLAHRTIDLVLAPGFSSWFVPQRVMGDAARFLEMFEEARSYFDGGIQVCSQIGHRPELALCHLGLAELLLDHYPDERDAAIEHLDFAIAEFREMKMQPALERALGRRGLLKA